MPITTNLRLLDSTREEEGTASLVQTMETFLAQFRWAKVKGLPWVGESIPGVVGVILVELETFEEEVDQYIWVIVGDVPPAYISSQSANSPREVLECYIAEMRAWVEAVRKGDSTDGLIPVNAAPTEANAAALDSRLTFLENRIVPDLQ
jgi:hypothetical protein